MEKIDRWVISHAFETLKEIGEKTPVIFSINISGASFSGHDFLGFVKDEIQKTGVDPHNIIFEITETVRSEIL